jgi:DNA polymerase-3 subunit chi
LTRIFFYHNAVDRIVAAALLLGKTYQQGKAILVYAPEAKLTEQIDRQLWLTPPTGFIPHARDTSPLAAETPIVITTDIADSAQNERLLILSVDVPPAFSRFTSVVEVVGQDSGERREAHERAKFYRERGYAIKFDFAEKFS